MNSTTSFEEEGFLRAARGREFTVHGHGADNTSGLLMLKAVVGRSAVNDPIEAAKRQALELHWTFDEAHADLVMLETIGLLNPVEQLAKDLAALGYHRLAERP